MVVSANDQSCVNKNEQEIKRLSYELENNDKDKLKLILNAYHSVIDPITKIKTCAGQLNDSPLSERQRAILQDLKH